MEFTARFEFEHNQPNSWLNCKIYQSSVVHVFWNKVGIIDHFKLQDFGHVSNVEWFVGCCVEVGY